MKRFDGAPALTPRVKLLPACLALALAVGSSLASSTTAYATAQAAQSAVPMSTSSAPIERAPWTAANRQSLVSFMQGKQRALPPLSPNAVVVNNCNDSGPGSYRQAVNDAVSGDTIDLTNTGCSTITLTTGDIITAVDDLTLQGPRRPRADHQRRLYVPTARTHRLGHHHGQRPQHRRRQEISGRRRLRQRQRRLHRLRRRQCRDQQFLDQVLRCRQLKHVHSGPRRCGIRLCERLGDQQHRVRQHRAFHRGRRVRAAASIRPGISSSPTARSATIASHRRRGRERAVHKWVVSPAPMAAVRSSNIRRSAITRATSAGVCTSPAMCS